MQTHCEHVTDERLIEFYAAHPELECGRCWFARMMVVPDGLSPRDLADAYNTICVPFGLPAVKALSASRRRKASLRLKEHPEPDFWRAVFQNVGKSRFLTGQQSDWRASFDWIVNNDRNAMRIAEGAYK